MARMKIETPNAPLPQGDLAENPAEKSASYDVPPVTRAIMLLRYIAAGNRCRNIAKASQDLP